VAWSATVQLNAGQKYPIRMEYCDHGGNASATLEWLPPGQSTSQVVPQLQLHPAQ
jgi:PA14 domain-containing protein